jgi:hypothetical protein
MEETGGAGGIYKRRKREKGRVGDNQEKRRSRPKRSVKAERLESTFGMRDSAKERGENEGNRGKDGKIWEGE